MSYLKWHILAYLNCLKLKTSVARIVANSTFTDDNNGGRALYAEIASLDVREDTTWSLIQMTMKYRLNIHFLVNCMHRLLAKMKTTKKNIMLRSVKITDTLLWNLNYSICDTGSKWMTRRSLSLTEIVDKANADKHFWSNLINHKQTNNYEWSENENQVVLSINQGVIIMKHSVIQSLARI